MTLRLKTLSIVGTILLAFLVVAYLVSSTIIRQGSERSEGLEARQALNGSVGILSQSINQMDRRFADWAAWDDVYRFVQDSNPEFIKVNLLDETLVNMQLNLLLIVDNSGRLVWGSGFDLNTRRRTPVPPQVLARLKPTDELLRHSSSIATTSGIFKLPESSLLIVSRPILNSKNQGPIRGTIIFGRYFDKPEFNFLSRMARLPMEFKRIDDEKLSRDMVEARSKLLADKDFKSGPLGNSQTKAADSGSFPRFVNALNEDTVAAYTVLPDIYQKPAVLMRVSLPRETYKQAQLNLGTLMISLLIAGLVFSVVTSVLLQKLVLSRWDQLSQDLEKISNTQDVSARVQVVGNDELSAVSRNTNVMLSALEKAQNERLESEARFKAFMNRSPTVAFMKDEDGRYIYVNQTFEESLEFPESQWKNKTDFDLWPQEIAQALREVDQGVLATNSSVAVREETPYDGEMRHWLSYKFPIVDPSGQRFLAGISVDITEQEKTEKALRDSQRFLQSTLDALTAHIAILDETGVVLAVNQAWRRFAQQNNYSGDNFGVGENYLSVCGIAKSAHEAELTAAGIRALLSRRLDRFTLEYPCPSPEEPRWFHLSATRFAVDDTMRIVVAHENITERKIMENSVRESEQRFRQMAENIHEVFWLVDTVKQQLLYVSPAFETIWGRKATELYQNPGLWMDSIHPEDRARIEEAARTKQLNSSYDEEFRILRPDGQIRIVHDRAFPIYGDNREVYRIVGVAEDITDRAKAQKALQEAHDEMEARVERRTAQLAAANSALLFAKEQAERANAAKSELLSRVSHELRTPLSAILGFGEILKDEDLIPSQEDSVDEILKAGNHLLSLINHVLNLTNPEHGSDRIHIEPVEISEVLNKCVAQQTELAAEHRIYIEMNRSDIPVMWVHGNREMMIQVFSIILENAIKYNQENGKVKIKCDLDNTYGLQGDNGHSGSTTLEPTLRVSICDTGRGIGVDYSHRVFSAFDRLKAPEYGIPGTGIGLTLAKSLIEAMGGQIGFESIEGEGSTFWVDLKMHDDSTEIENVVVEEVRPSVLYIEDNPSNMRLVERIMARRKDLDLISATKGEQGLALTQEKKPNLVLLDLHLPDCHGEDILRRIKADPAIQQIPVVVLSADATPKQIERLREAGASDYLTKPIDVAKLLELLEKRLPPSQNRN